EGEGRVYLAPRGCDGRGVVTSRHHRWSRGAASDVYGPGRIVAGAVGWECTTISCIAAPLAAPPNAGEEDENRIRNAFPGYRARADGSCRSRARRHGTRVRSESVARRRGVRFLAAGRAGPRHRGGLLLSL